MSDLGVNPDLAVIATNYLLDRTATYSNGSIQKTIRLTRGCPQGSKFGPRLWNLTMYPLLKQMNATHLHIVAYADDIANLVSGSTRTEIINRSEETLNPVVMWANARGK